MTTIALIVYVTMILPCWYILGGHVAWSDVRIDDDWTIRRPFKGSNLTFGIFLGLLCAVLWPISMVVLLATTIAAMEKGDAQDFAERRFYVPRKQKAKLTAERARENERETKRLEQEHGIGKGDNI